MDQFVWTTNAKPKFIKKIKKKTKIGSSRKGVM
jgi:hypothetical protein